MKRKMECELRKEESLARNTETPAYSREQLSMLSKDELMDIILSQQSARPPYVEMELLRTGGDLSPRTMNNTNSVSSTNANGKKQRKVKDDLDWRKYSLRHIALKFCYLGWDYHGLATSQNQATVASSDDTQCLFVEDCIFKALKRCKLIPENANWSSCEYSRSGRTDKGVSAFGQVISLRVRSNAASLEEKGVVSVGDGCKPGKQELDYVAVLNRMLPDDIRILGWAAVDVNFSSRFSTKYRTYKYLFVNNSKLDVEKMREGGLNFLGTHDFRNFCKYDPNTLSWIRDVITFSIDRFDGLSPSFASSALTVYVVTIKGSSFLWHQIRCMMQVLFLIGAQLESPNVISSLLDTTATPSKPIYELASELPLILYDCEYDDVKFNIDYEKLEKLTPSFLSYWESMLIKSEVSLFFLNEMTNGKFLNEALNTNGTALPLSCLKGKYVRLLDRERDVEFGEKKRKI